MSKGVTRGRPSSARGGVLGVAEVAARTVTIGDPSFAGPQAGVSLRLPVFHIVEPEANRLFRRMCMSNRPASWS
ncbi:MAG TPA: hypothetical protein DCZ69_17085 [Syntrophobacteraceae bacterium]|nr:hypothetical protein [Syntrophobacteraceae bacterium]HBD09967.1 hypothetical protein [Syntrophobacteraceae bacterium]HBZ57303.1 hypothetical protein [Syntrophobacteraceae bacterium]